MSNRYNNISFPFESKSSPTSISYIATSTKTNTCQQEFYPVEPKRMSNERLPSISQLLGETIPVLPPSSTLISEVEKREYNAFPEFNRYNTYQNTTNNFHPMHHPYYNHVPHKPKPTIKRLRRKFDEIVRLYKCNYGTCTKSYGTLNHLNCHIQLQNHGNKRSPNEFKFLLRDTSANDDRE